MVSIAPSVQPVYNNAKYPTSNIMCSNAGLTPRNDVAKALVHLQRGRQEFPLMLLEHPQGSTSFIKVLSVPP